MSAHCFVRRVSILCWEILSQSEFPVSSQNVDGSMTLPLYCCVQVHMFTPVLQSMYKLN